MALDIRYQRRDRRLIMIRIGDVTKVNPPLLYT